MKADWEPRVSRLEMGFCGAFVLIFAAIITSYLMLAGKIDSTRDAIAVQAQAASEARADVRVLNERTITMDKKLDEIAKRLDPK